MEFAEIIPGRLWIGTAPRREDLVKLRETLGPEPVVVDLNRSPFEEESCRELGITYDERTPLVEDTVSPVPISKLRLVARLVNEHVQNGRQVYLHCTAGRGRSPTCAAAYLIYSGMSLSDARQTVRGKREVWNGTDANYAESLDDFAKMMEIVGVSESGTF